MYRTGRPRLRTTRCLGWSGYSSLCKVGEFIKPSTPVAHRECSQPDVYCEFGKVRLEMLQGRVVVSLDHQIYRAPRACPVRSKVGIDVFVCCFLHVQPTTEAACTFHYLQPLQFCGGAKGRGIPTSAQFHSGGLVQLAVNALGVLMVQGSAFCQVLYGVYRSECSSVWARVTWIFDVHNAMSVAIA